MKIKKNTIIGIIVALVVAFSAIFYFAYYRKFPLKNGIESRLLVPRWKAVLKNKFAESEYSDGYYIIWDEQYIFGSDTEWVTEMLYGVKEVSMELFLSETKKYKV